MRRERNSRIARPHKTHRIAPAVAVARRDHGLDARNAVQVVKRLRDDGVCDLGPVCRQELGRVEVGVVNVHRRRLAVEEIRRDSQVPGTGEAIGKAGQVSGLREGLAGGVVAYSLASLIWMPKTSVRNRTATSGLAV